MQAYSPLPALCLCVCVVGDRAEGAEAMLEAGLNKLTLTVAQKEEGDSGDEQDPQYINPDVSSPSSAATILLLNSA